MTRRRLAGLGGALTIVMVVVIALAVGGSSSGAGPGNGGTSAAPPSTAAPRTTTTPAPAAPAVGSTPAAPAEGAPKPDPGLPTTRARAAARVLLVGFGGPSAPPSLLNGLKAREYGGVVLEPGNGQSPQQVADVVSAITRAAADAKHEAPLIAASQLGGDLDAVPVDAPSQGSASTPAKARANALAVAKVLHPLGIRMVLAPDADVGYAGGPWQGVAFGDDPATTTAMATAAVSGWKDGEVAPAPGHFPGEGAASGDPALGPATVGLSLADLKARDLQPFAALAGHTPAIQLSSATYVAWDGVTPATLLPGVVKLLRDELKFDGVIVSGDLQAASLSGGQPVSALAVEALKAGCDLVWIPGDAGDQAAAWRAIVKAMKDGTLPVSRVADALRRVATLRAQYGVG